MLITIIFCAVCLLQIFFLNHKKQVMKKLLFSTSLILAGLTLNAQIKLWAGGQTAIGFTSQAPLSGFKMQLTGNSAFSSSTSSISSAAFIRGNNAYSEANMTNSKGPDYTWVNDDVTGIFHPGNYIIGFSCNGTEKMRMHSNGFIGIGTTSPSSMLSVGGSGNSAYGAYIYNAQTVASACGLSASVASPVTSGYNAYALIGSITCGSSTINAYSFGVRGSSYNSTAQSSGQAYGVYGQAGNAGSGYNYGVWGTLLGSNNGAGIVGSVGGTNFSIPAQYAAYFDGQIRTTNDSPIKPTAGSWTGASDIRLKKDTASFKDGLNVLRKIHPITYKFTGAGGLPSQKTNIGISAQQVETVAPYCISSARLIVKQSESASFGADVVGTTQSDSSGSTNSIVNIKTFNYDPFIYMLINAVNQLDSSNSDLRKQLASLQGLVSRSLVPTGTEDQKEGILDEKKINNGPRLSQNVPNPFNQATTIKCYVPEESKSANLMVFDLQGTLKKTIPVNGRGETFVTIQAKEFVAGMYHYSLIINGQEIDTKKMILTE